MMLIDDRIPPLSDPALPAWEPDWRLWAWALAAIASFAGSFMTAGLLSFVLLCIAVACGARAITRALPYGEGLREYRQ